MFPRLLNVFQPILDIKYFLAKDMVVVVVYIVGFFFFITLAMFFAFHLWLVFNAMTTIEYREKSHHRHLFKASHIKFDYGYYQNFVHVFGPPWMWLLPISPPADHFLTMQYDFLRSQPPSKNEQAEITRQKLLKHLLSSTTRQEYIREAGSYYTPLPKEKFQLWKVSLPELQDIPSEKSSKAALKFTTGAHDAHRQGQEHALGVGFSSEEEGAEESEEELEGLNEGVVIHSPEGVSPVAEDEQLIESDPH